MNTRRTLKVLSTVAASCLLVSACSQGAPSSSSDTVTADSNPCGNVEGYPNGPVELIVPWSAGGGTDSVARFLGKELSERLGVQVNVVNRTGGGGVIGHQAMADAPKDGQSIGLVTAEIAMMHWQGLTDLTPESVAAISQINEDAATVSVAANSPYETIQDLLDAIKENPGKLTSSGTAQGGIGHLAMLGMIMEEGLKPDAVTWVPSDGAAPAVQELVSGGVDFIVTSSIGEVASMIDAQEVRPLAVMADEQSELHRDTPLLSEATGNSFTGGTWRGLVAPLGTKPEIIDFIDCNVEDIVKGDDYTSFMNESGFGVLYRDSSQFADFMKKDDVAKGEIMTTAGLAE